MLQSFYTALSGLRSQQYNIDTTANNVANISTVGYKAGRVDFADLLYTQMKRPAQSEEYLQNGNGIRTGAVQRITDTGVPIPTGNNLDFMLDGQGYFTLSGPQGQLYFTRDGSFRVSMEAGGAYLVSADGLYVLGADNQRIKIPGNSATVAADLAGTLSQNGFAFAQLKVTKFANPSGLLDAGGNKLAVTPAAGAATAGAGATAVRQGTLEGSNVDLATELTRLMRAQRVFSALGSALRTADEMESQATTMPR